jgi:hypothetical protein
MEQSRRDDLESLAYVLVYLAKGQLPWQGIKVPKHIKDTKTFKNEAIRACKEQTTPSQLCQGLPVCFYELLMHSQSLGFTSDPNYDYMIELFAQELQRRGWAIDWRFSWTM